jgi:hypothetical protein
MLNWKRNFVVATLVLIMIVPVTAHAAVEEGSSKASTESMQMGDMQKKHAKLHHNRQEALKMGIHRQTYLLLLAEKYTPEDLAEWKAAFDERERIIEEFKSLELKEKRQDKKAEVREGVKEKMKGLHEKVKNGELTREQAREQLKQWRESHKENFKNWKEDKREELAPILEARKQLHEEFTQAIASGDEQQIKSVLPKLLEEMNRVNDRLNVKLEEIKKNLADKASN